MEKREKNLKKVRVVTQYKKVFNTHDGKAVLYDLMRGNYILNRTTHVPGDPYSTARNEGQRDVVLRILSVLKMDPEQFLKLLEAQEQEENHV